MSLTAFRRSPPDPRDRDFAAVRPRLPRASGSDVILPERTPIGDQGGIGSCVGNATCDAFELVAEKPIQLSRLFVYWNARRSHGEEGRDEGTYPRAAFRSLTSLGVCPEALWPHDEAHVLERPPVLAYESAYDHRLYSYYAIKSRGAALLDDIESAVRGGLPVVFGTNVGDAFEQTNGVEALDAPRLSRGGHAIVCVGMRTTTKGAREWLIRNSWGRTFGAGGYCWFSSAYMTDPATSDFWVPLATPAFEGS